MKKKDSSNSRHIFYNAGMSAPVLATKLYIQPPRTGVVPRPRLIERLNEGRELGHKLTLISASAGFGKTTLVSEWIPVCGKPVAWISLDEGDNDPARFISYLIKALQTIKPGISENLLAALQSPQPLQIETILTTLLNEISAVPGNFLLVLDDYHLIDSRQVDQSLAFLIEHQPPQMHLAIVTREDPNLPLARLRARNQCAELRATDLRFTPAEAAEFLNRVMGLNLSGENIAALEARTEGWIAGLQLAAISMRGHKDAADFIQSFTGSHRFVMDYLLEEVLQQQPETIQSFLLRTSILDRMCGPLCDAVLGKGESEKMRDEKEINFESSSFILQPSSFILEYLERANLFIVPLDNERRWSRYHHLFMDLLRKRLGQNLTFEEIAELHIRASEWYDDNDLMLEAFCHATAANDIGRAMRLMESRRMPIHVRGAATTILDWLESLPDTARNAQPVLWWKQAALMLTIGQTTGAEEILQKAEAALAAHAELDEATRDLIGKIAVTRANLAQLQIQIEPLFVQARRALEYLNPDNLSHRSSATCALGYAYFWQNDLDKANQAYVEALALAQTAGDIPNSILASIRLGQLRKDQNQLYLATETYQHALQLLGDYSDPNAIVAYLGLAEIFYLWNNLDGAERYAEQGLKLAQQYDQITDRIIMSKLHLVIIKLARGDISGAAQLVSQAEQTSRQKNYASRHPNLVYFQALIHLHQGNLGAADQLTRDNDLPIMRARVFIKQNESSAALEILEQLRQDAEAKGMAARLLDVMTVQSVALYACGEKEKAVELLGEVLARTEPEGWIRLFVDEGEPMRWLLSDFQRSVEGRFPALLAYTDKLLAAFPQSEIQIPESKIELLSPRELEVLQLIAQGFSNQEICQRLFLALDTVKGHNRRIFEKLQVKRRTEAIARARELGLL